MVERPIAYVDTSLLVKRYLAEPDSSAAIGLLETLDIVTSTLSVLEITSALHAASRAGLITEADLERLLGELEADRDTWGLLAITPGVLQRARSIVGPQTLRSLDAIHCATAVLYRDDRGKPVSFATLDRRQRDAASALGFDCLQV